MKTLNLVYPEKSDITYEIVRYPDGQISFKLLNAKKSPVEQITRGRGLLDNTVPEVLIKTRMNSYEDLMILLSANDVLSKIAQVSLFCPYIFGSRSDRRFEEFQSFDLKIICDMIKGCNFKKITILDPHSNVLPALLEGNSKIEILDQHNWLTFGSEDARHPLYQLAEGILISPDTGAYGKTVKLGQKFGMSVIPCNKFRDSKGEITLEVSGNVEGEKCCIVDDICDGGKTFTELAKKLRELGAREVNLFVTHGIYSKGFLEGIDSVWSTNSIRDTRDNDCAQLLSRINIFE